MRRTLTPVTPLSKNAAPFCRQERGLCHPHQQRRYPSTGRRKRTPRGALFSAMTGLKPQHGRWVSAHSHLGSYDLRGIAEFGGRKSWALHYRCSSIGPLVRSLKSGCRLLMDRSPFVAERNVWYIMIPSGYRVEGSPHTQPDQGFSDTHRFLLLVTVNTNKWWRKTEILVFSIVYDIYIFILWAPGVENVPFRTPSPFWGPKTIKNFCGLSPKTGQQC